MLSSLGMVSRGPRLLCWELSECRICAFIFVCPVSHTELLKKWIHEIRSRKNKILQVNMFIPRLVHSTIL